jgi:hypothetical protein
MISLESWHLASWRVSPREPSFDRQVSLPLVRLASTREQVASRQAAPIALQACFRPVLQVSQVPESKVSPGRASQVRPRRAKSLVRELSLNA